MNGKTLTKFTIPRQRGKEKCIACDFCDMEFGQHCELEWHIKKEHKDNCLEFQCDICLKGLW